MHAVPTHTPTTADETSRADLLEVGLQVGPQMGIATWADETSFWASDARRRDSDEVELGATWRRPGSDEAWKLSWLSATGELYLCRLVGYPASCTDVTVLTTVATEQELDALLDGWRDHRSDEDGLGWLAARLTPLPRSA